MRALYFVAISTVASALPESSTTRSSANAMLVKQRSSVAALLNVVTTADNASRAMRILRMQRSAIQRKQPPEQQAPPSGIEREMRIERKTHRCECQRRRECACARAGVGVAPCAQREPRADDP